MADTPARRVSSRRSDRTRFTTPAIVLRRMPYGDADLIVTLLTPERGKFAAIAKSARRSTRRFGGILEPFAGLEVVCSTGRGRLPVLQEAVLKQPCSAICGDFCKTAYASYWAELLCCWLEDDEKQDEVYHLLRHVLGALSEGREDSGPLSVFFQIRLMALAGFSPVLNRCGGCGQNLDEMPGVHLVFDLKKGSLICGSCAESRPRGSAGPAVRLSKGSARQLLWLIHAPTEAAKRLRFSDASLGECLAFLEAFVPYHLGKTPRSLGVLRQLRKGSS